MIKTTGWSLQNQAGFTLVELLIVAVLMSFLFGFSTIGLTNLIPKFQRVADLDVLLTDLKEQRLRAIEGERIIPGMASYYGVRFETDQYITFQGTSYNPAETTNVATPFDGQIFISDCTSPNLEVVFSPVTGQLNGVGSGEVSCVLNGIDADNRIKVNKYGVVTIEKL